MSLSPIPITNSSEEILGKLNQKIDNLEGDVTEIKAEIAEVKEEIKALEIKVNKISKRLAKQEFINRTLIIGFVLTIAAGGVKLFFPNVLVN